LQLDNQQLGQMLVSLCYQPADSTLTIIVLKAANLPRIGTTKLISKYDIFVLLILIFISI
jgi:hypothetical protein